MRIHNSNVGVIRASGDNAVCIRAVMVINAVNHFEGEIRVFDNIMLVMSTGKNG
jgi:hypothetical protein